MQHNKTGRSQTAAKASAVVYVQACPSERVSQSARGTNPRALGATGFTFAYRG